MTGDPADWDHDNPQDVQSAFLGTGMAFIYSEADIIALNAMGFAIDGAPTISGGSEDSFDPLAGGSGARLDLSTSADMTITAGMFERGFDMPSEAMTAGAVGSGIGDGPTEDSPRWWLAAEVGGYL